MRVLSISCTDQFIVDGRRSMMFTEVEELIKMLAKKVWSHCVTSHQTQEPQHKPVSTVYVCVSVCVCVRKKLENFSWQGACLSN